MKESKLLNIIKNMSYTLGSNLLSMILSVFAVLIVPKFVGVEAYGYYQLYMFYIGYVGVSYFGFCDGIYLREGGNQYSNLSKPLYSSQYWALFVYELVFYSAIILISLFVVDDKNRLYIIVYTGIAGVAICLIWFIVFILQATGRIKEYATITVVQKIIYVIIVISAISFGIKSFHSIIIANLFGIYISLFIGMYYCKEAIFSRPCSLTATVCEIKSNLKVGFPLMIASLSSGLILGVVRFGVENHWDIATFGKVSLTLSLSNMVMTAINAIAVVMYPMLRRTDEGSLPKIYGIMRVLLMGLIFGGIVFYYPAYRILSLWLPQYAESLRYAAILLPMCAYESKMSMLVNTYFKTLRLENLLMKCNMAALALSVVLTLVSTLLLNSVTAAIISILIVLVFRCILSEIILSTKLPIKVIKDIFIELVMTIAFIICNWYFGFIGMLMYAVCYVIYLIIKRKDILESLNFIKSMR